jgi:hypothetical protein
MLSAAPCRTNRESGYFLTDDDLYQKLTYIVTVALRQVIMQMQCQLPVSLF